MALIVGDRVQETTTTTGTGTVALLGAITQFQSFSSAIGDGNSTYYMIADQSGINWEEGIGTYTASGSTLSRTTVLSSSNANALVNFPAGTKNVFCTYPAKGAVLAAPFAYPTIRPSLNLDFANSRQLDPRITFSRNSTASYYDGKTTALAEQNLLLYSQDFTNAAWSKSNITATGNIITAPDGTTTASLITNSVAGSCILQQSLALATAIFTQSAFLKIGTERYVGVRNNGSVNNYAIIDLQTGIATQIGSGATVSIVVSTNGFYRVSVTMTAPSTSNLVWYFTDNNATAGYNPSVVSTGLTFYIWGAQLEQRSSATAYTPTTATAITNYIPQLMTAGINVPRLDYDPITGKCLGLLIEESRTNLISTSVNLMTAVGTATATALSYISPDSTLTGILVTGATSPGVYPMANSLAMTPSVSSSTTYTWSIYLRSATATTATIAIRDQSTGTFIPLVCPLTNLWQRFSITITTGATTTQLGLYLGGANGSFAQWGLQLEVGSVATSYIPTTSGAVTRGADVAQMTGTNFSSWYNQSQGSLYLESDTTCFSEFDAGTASTRLALVTGYPSSNTASFNAVYPIGTSTAVTASQSNYIYGQSKYKLTGSYFSGSTISTSFNGQGTTSLPLGSLPTYTRLAIGSNLVAGTYLNGHIKKISYYPIALTSAELQGITTL